MSWSASSSENETRARNYEDDRTQEEMKKEKGVVEEQDHIDNELPSSNDHSYTSRLDYEARSLYADSGFASEANGLILSRENLVLLRSRTRTSAERDERRQDLLNTAEKEHRVTFWQKVWNTIRPNYFLNHYRDLESLKIIFRTWVSLWVSLILMLVNRPLQWFGRLPFMMPILLFIDPPGGRSVAYAVIRGLEMLAGIVWAWLHCVISMAISMRLRGTKYDSASDFSKYLITNNICEKENIQLCVQGQIFAGKYIEAKVTIIHAIASAFLVFEFFLLRIYDPLLTPVSVISSITGLVCCTYTSYYPYMSGVIEMGELFFKSCGISLALRVVVCCFIFPVTSLYNVVSLGIQKMRILRDYNGLHMDILTHKKPSHDDFVDMSQLESKMRTVRDMALPLMIESSYIDKEISYLRLGASQIHKWLNTLVELSNNLSGIEYFYMNILECKKWVLHYGTQGKGDTNFKADFELSSNKSESVGEYEKKRRAEGFEKFLNIHEDEANAIKNIEELDILMKTITELFIMTVQTCHEILEASIEWLSITNEFRLSRFLPHKKRKYMNAIAQCSERISALRKRLYEDLNLSNDKWKSTFAESDEKLLIPLAGQASLFSFCMRKYVHTLDSICDMIEEWDRKYPKPRVIFPLSKLLSTSFVKSFYSVYNRDAKKRMSSNYLLNEDIGTFKLNPDAIRPTTKIGKVCNKVAGSYTYLVKETCFLLGLKTSIITIVCNMMGYFPSSVHFYYAHRVVWFPILAAISVASDSYDSVYQVIVRIGTTFLGAFAGACGWYISCGNGQGNPYGLGAVCAVLFFFFAFHRHFSVHTVPMPAVLPAVTLCLVLGMSWENARIPQVASLKWGLGPAVSRFLCVVGGTLVAFLISCFPKASSGSLQVRFTVASVLRDIGAIHCYVQDYLTYVSSSPELRDDEFKQQIDGRILNTLWKASSTFQIITKMKYEPQFSGKWPKKKYKMILRNEIHLIKLYYLLVEAINLLEYPKVWGEHISKRLGWRNEFLLSDFFAVITMCSSSLRLGNAMPKITPSELALSHLALLADMGLGDPFFGTDDVFYRVKSRASSIGSRNLTVNMSSLVHTDGRINMVSLIFMHLIYENIDLLLILVKSLVGEDYEFAFDNLHKK